MVKDYDGLLRESSNPLGLAIQSWQSLDKGFQTILIVLLIGIVVVIRKLFFPDSRKSSRDKDWYSGNIDHDSFGGGGGSDGGGSGSDGGGGSSTGF
jgi:hypothetical protein